YVMAHGEAAEGTRLAQRTLARMRRSPQTIPLEHAVCMMNFGSLCSQLKRWEEANAAFNEVLDFAQRHLKQDDFRWAGLYGNLAMVRSEQKDFAGAEGLFVRALEIAMDSCGSESAEYGLQLFNLAVLYDNWARESGQAARHLQAREYARQA